MINTIQRRIALTPELELLEFVVPRSDDSFMTVYTCVPNQQIPAPRPVLLFLHGQGASSVFASRNGQMIWPPFFMALLPYVMHCNILFIEKRGVRLGDFNPGGFQGCSGEYLNFATRYDRVSDVIQLIEYLYTLELYDGSSLFMMGHCEGANVALAVANACQYITQLALLAYSPMYGFWDAAHELRRMVAAGRLSGDDFLRQYAGLTATFTEIRNNPDSLERSFMGHSFRYWASYAFSPGTIELLQLEIPVFVGNGTLDHAESLDLVVTDFIKTGKKNLTYRQYLNLDRGFYAHTAGKAECYQAYVVNDIMQWLTQCNQI